MTDDQLVLALAAFALRGECEKILEGVAYPPGTAKRPYRFPEDVPAQEITDLLDFLWNLLDEVRVVRSRIPPPATG